MCGRLALTLPPDVVRAAFGYAEQPNFPPRANVAPTQPVPIVRMERHVTGEKQRHFVLMRWGFLPGFVKDPKDFPLLINARAETLSEKPSFRNALKRRRCLFAADAYYEWQREGTGRGKGQPKPRPFLFRRRDGQPMAIAGLWETWAGPNGEEVDTACVITTAANGLTAAIHDRMPVILEPKDFDLWLDADETEMGRVETLMRPAGDDVLEFFEIAPDINAVRNDDPALQKPIGPVQRAEARVKPKPAAKSKPPQGDLFG